MDSKYPTSPSDFIRNSSINQKTSSSQPIEPSPDTWVNDPIVIASILWLIPISAFLVTILGKFLYRKYQYRRAMDRLTHVANLERLLILKLNKK